MQGNDFAHRHCSAQGVVGFRDGHADPEVLLDHEEARGFAGLVPHLLEDRIDHGKDIEILTGGGGPEGHPDSDSDLVTGGVQHALGDHVADEALDGRGG